MAQAEKMITTLTRVYDGHMMQTGLSSRRRRADTHDDDALYELPEQSAFR